MQEDSCPDYMQKAEDALRAEEERVTNYLHVDTKPKLLAEVEREILEKHQTELLEKEQSGAAALMRDDKVLHAPPPLRSTSKLLQGVYCGTLKKHQTELLEGRSSPGQPPSCATRLSAPFLRLMTVFPFLAKPKAVQGHEQSWLCWETCKKWIQCWESCMWCHSHACSCAATLFFWTPAALTHGLTCTHPNSYYNLLVP